MWIADGWQDYGVLDAANGEKLERWGKYTLIRPDPQVIWQTDKTHPGWNRPNAHYHRSTKGGGSWEFFDLPKTWQISYGNLVFNLKPFSFKHTGLFPEQAANWDWFSGLIRKAGRPIRVLNLFAYTGGATCAALAAGASVTHVDASKGMVAWASENAESSGLSDCPVRWLVDDCTKFVRREIRRGNKYDAIIMDPPSYGRGPKGEIWKIEETIYPLLLLCRQLLSDAPLFFLLNSYTTGLQPGVLAYMLRTAIAPDTVPKSKKEGDSDANDATASVGRDAISNEGAASFRRDAFTNEKSASSSRDAISNEGVAPTGCGMISEAGKNGTSIRRTGGKSMLPIIEADEVGLPVEGTSLVLPCGCAGRVTFCHEDRL